MTTIEPTAVAWANVYASQTPGSVVLQTGDVRFNRKVYNSARKCPKSPRTLTEFLNRFYPGEETAIIDDGASFNIIRMYEGKPAALPMRWV